MMQSVFRVFTTSHQDVRRMESTFYSSSSSKNLHFRTTDTHEGEGGISHSRIQRDPGTGSEWNHVLFLPVPARIPPAVLLSS
mmetsp:Transcript_30957/g.48529  ORF Transcript_30957/g.48529 Transcript_30957/m.48529 type:complete len:82 (-) Transcript_30957:170-415(-)